MRAYLQSIPRHITYGAVVGTLYERLRRRLRPLGEPPNRT